MVNVKFVTKNKLTVEAEQKSKKRATWLLIGGLFSFILFFISPYISFLPLFIAFLISGNSSESEILRSGAEGEDLALAMLKHLPDEFSIYNQVDIPNKKSRTGFNEADIIVAGKNAVFVIEVKHNNGIILGSESDKEWEVEKIGRNGTSYFKAMRNPIAQTKRLVWLLSEDMKKKKTRTWIQGIVVFSNEDVQLDITNSSDIPVLGLEALNDYISTYKPPGSQSLDFKKVTKNIKELKIAENA